MKFFLPIKTISEANNTDHWSKKYKRKKSQEQIVKLIVSPHISPENIKFPCELNLTRISPRKLDYDNLCYCFKSLNDILCSLLIPGLKAGRADGTGQITTNYFQKKGLQKEYGVEVEFRFSL